MYVLNIIFRCDLIQINRIDSKQILQQVSQLLRGYNVLLDAFQSHFPEDQVRRAVAIKDHEAFVTMFTALDALKVFTFKLRVFLSFLPFRAVSPAKLSILTFFNTA